MVVTCALAVGVIEEVIPTFAHREGEREREREGERGRWRDRGTETVGERRRVALCGLARMKRCKHLIRGDDCPWGCETTRILCHAFVRGECRWGAYCRRGLHAFCRPPPPPPPPEPDSKLREARIRLGLNPSGENVNQALVKAAFHLKAKEQHPDKNPHQDQAKQTRKMQKLLDANNFLMTDFARGAG